LLLQLFWARDQYVFKNTAANKFSLLRRNNLINPVQK